MNSSISKDLNFIYILKQPNFNNEVDINFQDLTVSNRGLNLKKNDVTELNNGNPDENLKKALRNAGWKSPMEFDDYDQKINRKYKNEIFELDSKKAKIKDDNDMLKTWKITLIVTSSVLFIALLILIFLKGKKGKNK